MEITHSGHFVKTKSSDNVAFCVCLHLHEVFKVRLCWRMLFPRINEQSTPDDDGFKQQEFTLPQFWDQTSKTAVWAGPGSKGRAGEPVRAFLLASGAAGQVVSSGITLCRPVPVSRPLLTRSSVVFYWLSP